MIELYKVTFRKYTNSLRDTVRNDNGDYIDTPDGCLIASEETLEALRQYGEGFKTVEYVGTLYQPKKAICDDDFPF